MRNKIFSFLRQYSTNTTQVDRLIVSAFLHKRNITTVNNIFLTSYLINPSSLVEWKNLNDFIQLIASEDIEFELEDLIQLFEFVISPADRVVNGAIYTPINIRRFITEACLNHINLNAKISDIACGCGGFLLTVAQLIRERDNEDYFNIFQNNIYGLDIQEYSTVRTKLLLTILAILEGEDREEFQFNIYTGDALTFQWAAHIDNFIGFQAIVGNPPYVSCRNLDVITKEALRHWSVARSGNPDLYIPFFQIGLENLSENGILGFITMNTFFKSLNGRELRAYFQEELFDFRIIDFGSLQVFKSRNTYTCICLITKTPSHALQYYRALTTYPETEDIVYDLINYNQLNARSGWNLVNHDNITVIEATGRPFGDLFSTRHGIATLKNDIYIFRPEKEDTDYYYLRDGDLIAIEKEICRDVLNSNKLSRPNDYELLVEKIIFPYDDQDRPKLLEEDDFSSRFPKTYQYLLNRKTILDNRDKGVGDYEVWYAYGRTQSLEKVRHKLFFPKYSDITPSFILNNDPNLLFYNGLAVISDNEEDLFLAKKIMETRLFWYYIQSTSKPYSSAYYSLNGNYIRNFGVCNLTDEQREYILNETNKNLLDEFFEAQYGINF